MRFPGRMLAEHWIKRHHLENVDGLKAELFCDPKDGIVTDEAEVFLPQMQEGHRRASTVLVGVTRNRRFHFSLQFSGNLDGRRVCHR
jgi:hypothetical protein